MVNNGFIRMAAQMTGFLKKMIEKNNFSAKYVVFSIGGRNAFVREITVPTMPDEEMRQAAIWDAGQYVPYEANSYYTDAAKFGKPDASWPAAHAPGGSAQRTGGYDAGDRRWSGPDSSFGGY
jgi:Tfp pilus assembly PilM family ATPase